MIKNIVIDPGHGGLDSKGAYTTAPYKMHVFEDGEVAYEGVLNRGIADKLVKELEDSFNIIETNFKKDGSDMPLFKRVNIANRASINKSETLFVSIHCNAFNGEASGFEIFTSPGDTLSDVAAEAIANAVEPLYLAENIKLRYDLSDGDKDKEAKFRVLTKTSCPAVLIECGFFDNRAEFDKLKDPVFQANLAVKIAEGIRNYANDFQS